MSNGTVFGEPSPYGDDGKLERMTSVHVVMGGNDYHSDQVLAVYADEDAANAMMLSLCEWKNAEPVWPAVDAPDAAHEAVTAEREAWKSRHPLGRTYDGFDRYYWNTHKVLGA